MKRLLIILVLFISYSITFAQDETTGAISGHVWENDGVTPIVDAWVNAQIVSGGPHYGQSSGTDGSYVITNLPVGDYMLTTNPNGYTCQTFDRALTQEDIDFVKVNAGDTIKGINFFLERGGSIAGHVYDAETKEPLEDIDVEGGPLGIYYPSGCRSNSNSDGSYVIWGDFPTGYCWVHAPTCSHYSAYILDYDSTKTVYVHSPDTTFGVDFYLSKGGAISGRVLEEDGVSPIRDATVVVTSEDHQVHRHSNTQTNGDYIVPGLPSRRYPIGVTVGIDPTKYHMGYYDNKPRREDATLVDVTAPDTTRGIDIILSRVVYQSISNSFIEATVTDRYPGCNLTVGNTGGLPETIEDNDKDLMFGHPSPYTSFTTIRMDGGDYIYGSDQGDLTTDPYISADGKSITRVWTLRNLAITQKVSLVQSTWSLNQYEDTAELRYVIVNQDNTSHEVGLRIMLDTMLGDNDGAPLMIPYSEYSDYEREFLKSVPPGIPPWWTAIEGDVTSIIFSAQGTMTEGQATAPDRFVTAAWTEIFNTRWDYTVSSDRKVIFDSAVAMWWNPVTVAPEETLKVVTYYGLGEGTPDLSPPYTDQHDPLKEATEVSVHSNIALHIKDDHKGVDRTSVVLKVDEEQVTPEIMGELKDYTIIYNPVHAFKYNQQVTVSVDAKDLAWVPNAMETEVYTIRMATDTIPPYTTDHNPAGGAVNIPADGDIIVHVRDNLAGVDLSSLTMEVEGEEVTPEVSGTESDYGLTHHPSQPLACNDTIDVVIRARDLALPANVMKEDRYRFFTEVDKSPPFTTDHNPRSEERNVALNADISLRIRDNFSGVDTSSILLKVDGVEVIPEITGTPLNYLVSYDPPQDFHDNQIIEVQVEAEDQAHPHNVMEREVYHFRTVQILPDLMAIDLRPEEQLVVGEAGRVLGQIRNEIETVGEAFHVLFRSGGTTLKDTLINGMSIDEVVTIPARVLFSERGTHEVEMMADSRDEITELAETNNTQKLVIEILQGPAGQLVVRPNPFTPNGDGYNDEVVFQVAGMGLDSPVVKIFDRRGMEVKEIKESSDYWLVWDGKNENGREMEPGVYLYLLMDGAKKLNSGTVVLAR